MNILIISQYFWPENFRINEMAKGLKDKGHNITVLTGIPNYPQGKFYKGYSLSENRKENYSGVKIIRAVLIPRGNSSSVKLILNCVSFAICASFTAIFSCKEKYDLIFVFEPSPITVGLPAVILKKLKKIPILFWVQDLWPESLSATGSIKSPFLLKIVGRFVKFIYKNCDKLLIQSKGFTESIESFDIQLDKIQFFPNWAGESQLPKQNEEINKTNQIKSKFPDGFNILFAGNIGVAQDFETIISAMENIPAYKNINLIIMGEGRKRNWVKNQIKEKNLSNIYLFEKCLLAEIQYYYSNTDALLVSLKDEAIFNSTIPAKVQSYLYSGKPIIAALNGEGSKIIKESGSGLTCPSSDKKGLSEIILLMYNKTPEERKQMGKNGLNYYNENFEFKKLLNKLESWMQDQLIKNNKA